MTYKPPYRLLKSARGRSGKHRIGRYMLGGLSLLLLAAGLYTTTTWVTAGGIGHLFPSDTPTPSITPTASLTPTITNTPTINTPTASAPFLYTIELGDTISTIAEKFNVDFIIIMVLNGLDNESALGIQVGDQLVIPNPDMEIPQPTALPANLRRGDEILYLVLPGDTLDSIANEFLSTIDDILAQNDLENPNQIFVGQLLTIRVFLVTATPGPSPTPQGTPAPTSGATATP